MRVAPLLALAVRGLLVRGLRVPGLDRLQVLRRGWACKGMCVVWFGVEMEVAAGVPAVWYADMSFVSGGVVVVDAGGREACMA